MAGWAQSFRQLRIGRTKGCWLYQVVINSQTCCLGKIHLGWGQGSPHTQFQWPGTSSHLPFRQREELQRRKACWKKGVDLPAFQLPSTVALWQYLHCADSTYSVRNDTIMYQYPTNPCPCAVLCTACFRSRDEWKLGAGFIKA